MILKILPEINKIKNGELKSKVIAIWEEAMAFRGWTPEILQAIPFTLLAENVKITFIEHVRTVCKMCIACDKILTEAYGERKTKVDRDHLIAGALLADVGKLLEYEIVNGKAVKSDFGKQLRHPFSGVGLAFKHDVPPEVLHVIACHSKEGDGEKRSPETIIFHHTDFIDFELVK